MSFAIVGHRPPGIDVVREVRGAPQKMVPVIGTKCESSKRHSTCSFISFLNNCNFSTSSLPSTTYSPLLAIQTGHRHSALQVASTARLCTRQLLAVHRAINGPVCTRGTSFCAAWIFASGLFQLRLVDSGVRSSFASTSKP